ncbi:MAG: SanA/YdcF family protein, partial [Cyclobacteriaceae bacterium]
MKLLRFFRFVLITAIVATLVIEVIYFDVFGQPFQSWNQFGKVLKSHVQELTTYFIYADAWNYIALLIFISLLFILFVISSAFLKRYLFRSQSNKFKPLSFSAGGILWGSHKFLSVGLALIFLVGLINTAVFVFSYSRIVTDIDDINAPQTALLLGTSKTLSLTGEPNQYYRQRIQAMVDLYQSGKVNRIIISGDNGRDDYNEPANMKVDLIRHGIDGKIIELDFAGFRTLDSMVRLRWHFDVSEVILVSQRFHLERAIFLAWFYDVEAIGFRADGNMSPAMVKRELLAKPKA